KHTGPALVFDDYPAMKKAIDDPDLDVTADHVLILRNAGPQGGPGMPEWGMLPIPTKLVKQGVRDMVRLSDARMSGTSYGACILHVSPESFIGGPLALVRQGEALSPEPRDSGFASRPGMTIWGEEPNVKAQRRHPRQARDRLHRDGRDRALQARPPHPVHSGCASVEHRPADPGGRGLYAA